MTAYYNEKVERMSAEEKKALQSERLVKVVKRVYDNVPTYRAKMDAIGLKPEDIKSIDDITKLPFTTKSDLRNNYPFGMFASPLKDIVRLHASSGTTGKLTVAGCTQHDLDDWSEAVARGFVSCGVGKDSIIHVAYLPEDSERTTAELCSERPSFPLLPETRTASSRSSRISARIRSAARLLTQFISRTNSRRRASPRAN